MTADASLSRTRGIPEIRVDELGGMCPVQATGTVDGVPFYFRARGDNWSIEIGEGNTDRIVNAFVASGSTAESDRLEAIGAWIYSESFGTWPEAGYMSDDEARAFIAKGADLWRVAIPRTDDGGRE